jgi:uncharacterized protein with NRDE domain
MCLLVIAHNAHPRYRLILAANRDEFYDRPTAPLDLWAEPPGMAAGRDLQGGGTWLGLDRCGRLAAVTNYREPGRHTPDAVTRGHLVTGFLSQALDPEVYLAAVARQGARYNGFNLIVGTPGRLGYISNRAQGIQLLPDGLHGLSNHLLGTPWPKVLMAREALARVLADPGEVPSEAVLEIMRDETVAADRDLPDTGVGLEWERRLSPVFIRSPSYGTRSTSVIRMDREDRVDFSEWTHPTTPGAPPLPPRRLTWRVAAD